MAGYIRIQSAPLFRIYAFSGFLHTRTDTPFGTLASESDIAAFGSSAIGEESGGGSVARRRLGLSFAIPINLRPTETVMLSVLVQQNVTDAFTIADIYYSDTDDSAAPANWWTHLDHLLASRHISAAQPAIDISALAQTRRGGNLSIVVVEKDEAANVNNNRRFGVTGGAFPSSLGLTLGV